MEELEEENLNQIDNVLSKSSGPACATPPWIKVQERDFQSNTVPKAEERKEARNAEQERIEEEERKRRARGERPSLRARLAKKKAIVAAGGGIRPQHEKSDRRTVKQ